MGRDYFKGKSSYKYCELIEGYMNEDVFIWVN